MKYSDLAITCDKCKYREPDPNCEYCQGYGERPTLLGDDILKFVARHKGRILETPSTQGAATSNLCTKYGANR